jgi:hypothetical protein
VAGTLPECLALPGKLTLKWHLKDFEQHRKRKVRIKSLAQVTVVTHFQQRNTSQQPL